MGTFSPYEDTRNESVAVGTTAIAIADSRNGSNNARKVITIRNISPNAVDIISLSLSSQGLATANTGIVLKQNESMTDAQDGGYLPFQDKITAICATANGLLSIFER